jgi:hypothetical protein
MQATGDTRCALCGGCGYQVPLSWGADPRLRRERAPSTQDEPSPDSLLEVFDRRGRVRPLWDRAAEAAVESPSDVATGDDPRARGSGLSVLDEKPALSILREERALALHVLSSAAHYRTQGRALVEGAQVDALKRDYELTPAVLEPLPLRQFLADASFSGSGRTDPERRWAFLRRDAVVFELATLGFPLERIADAIGLSETRLYSLPVMKLVHEELKWNQRYTVLDWHERGYSTQEIAHACGLPIRTVQRIIKRGRDPTERALRDSPLFKLIGGALHYGQVLAQMELFPLEQPRPEEINPEDFREGLPIDYFERHPPGMPFFHEGEAYHSYVPREQERLGAPADGNPRSSDVIHPFLFALLARTQLARRVGAIANEFIAA